MSARIIPGAPSRDSFSCHLGQFVPGTEQLRPPPMVSFARPTVLFVRSMVFPAPLETPRSCVDDRICQSGGLPRSGDGKFCSAGAKWRFGAGFQSLSEGNLYYVKAGSCLNPPISRIDGVNKTINGANKTINGANGTVDGAKKAPTGQRKPPTLQRKPSDQQTEPLAEQLESSAEQNSA